MTRPIVRIAPPTGCGSAIPSLALAALFAMSTPTHALSPPDPKADIPWDEDAVRDGEQNGYAGVVAIESAFDNARREEERQFGLPANSLGSLDLPDDSDWAALDIAHKALLIVNAERVARGGVPYPGGTPIGLPLEGVERHLDTLASDYASYMVANDFWAHEAPADGEPPFAGTDPFSRIDAAPVIGAGAGSDDGDCHAFLGQAENLGVYASSGGRQIRLPIERSLYGFLYEDSDSGWGHRHLVLLQDEPLDGGSGGYTDDTGTPGREGYLGVGTAGASDGSYSVFDDTATFPVQRNTVFLFIDPVPDEGCAYEIVDAPAGSAGEG